MREIDRTYHQHLIEQREAAFAKWKASGYRDLEAHALFMHLYTKLNGLLHKRSRKGDIRWQESL